MPTGVEINFETHEYTVGEPDGEREVCVRVASGTLQRNVVLTLETADSEAMGKLKRLFVFSVSTHSIWLDDIEQFLKNNSLRSDI